MSSQFLQVVRRLPRQERAELRIQQIVQAAEDVIGRKGLTAATMTEIAEVSRTSIGAIYQYFANKELLFEAIRSHHLRELDRRLAALASASQQAGFSTVCDMLVNLLVNFSASFPAYRYLFFSSEHEFHDAHYDDRLLRRFAPLCARGHPAGSAADINRMTRTLLILMKGVLEASVDLSWQEQLRLIEDARFVVRSFLHQGHNA